MRHVVVVGAGVAGTAAALAASREGARVTLLHGGTGASVLAGGALDDVPWEKTATDAAEALEEGARGVLDALDAYVVRESSGLVASSTGILRPARGIDRALLDLATLTNATVLVPRFDHGAWDAAAMARAWSASRRAEARGLRFIVVAANLLVHTEEQAFGDAELAERHDDDARLDWLVERVRELRASARERVDAILLPPWLGVSKERATALSADLGCPCGEVLGGVGGPSGLRFERARDRALSKAGVTRVSTRATRVAAAADGTWRVDTTESAAGDALACDAVILAVGGVLGGGLEYSPSGSSFATALPEARRALVRATVDAPVEIGAFGRPLDDPSSLFGGPPETHAWPFASAPLLDHAGVRVDASGEVGGSPGLFAAGEFAEGPRRTWLGALAHGARVGAAAARPVDTGVPRRIS